MWLYFDRNGALLRQLEHGDPARAGTTDFEIFAVFEGINDTATAPEGFLSLIKPDMTEEAYFELVVGKEKRFFIKEPHEGDISPFVDGQEYVVYHFDFAHEDTGELRTDVLLDTGGLWKAIITLLKNDDEIDVQGKITFNVQHGLEDEEGNAYTPEEWMYEIMRHYASKMDKRGSGTIRFIPDITELDYTRTNIYQAGDIVFDYNAHKEFYKIDSLDPFSYHKIDIAGGGEDYDFLSIKRLGAYIYEVTYDYLPDYVEPNEEETPITGCTSFVRDGKLYRNLDWNYDSTAEFHVICKNFEGIGFISGVVDGNVLDTKKQVEQLPYHLVDGRNNNGIRVSTHILFNDWEYDGEGEKNISITTLPFHILNELHNIDDIHTVLDSYLANIKIPTALKNMGYLIQYLITDGTTTYAILPPNEVGGSYSIVDITSNPKLTNFRWVNRATVSRSDSDIQLHPTGIERWNSVNINTSLSDLRFTKAYEESTRLSEFIGLRGTDKNSSDAELTEIYNTAHELYLERTRNGETWQTVHSIVYGDKKIESLWVQENYEKDYASLNGGSWGTIGGDINNQLDLKAKFDAKLDKDTQTGVYRVPANIDGHQLFYNVANMALGDTLALRGSSGTIEVTTPYADSHAANKSYTDSFAKSLAMNPSTYVLDLKDAKGNVLSSIDLPLETMVVSGSYDAATKKIILTLKNGQTVEIPVADLINGLATTQYVDNSLVNKLTTDTEQTVSAKKTFTGSGYSVTTEEMAKGLLGMDPPERLSEEIANKIMKGIRINGDYLGLSDPIFFPYYTILSQSDVTQYIGIVVGRAKSGSIIAYGKPVYCTYSIKATVSPLGRTSWSISVAEEKTDIRHLLNKDAPELNSMGTTPKSVVTKEFAESLITTGVEDSTDIVHGTGADASKLFVTKKYYRHQVSLSNTDPQYDNLFFTIISSLGRQMTVQEIISCVDPSGQFAYVAGDFTIIRQGSVSDKLLYTRTEINGQEAEYYVKNVVNDVFTEI